MKILFATGNNDKMREFERILNNIKIEQLQLDIPEIQSIEVEEVVKFKAEYAYKEVDLPVIVEDSGLYIEAWNRLPGALIKWFESAVKSEGICRMMKNEANRSAIAKCCIDFYDGQHNIFLGVVNGKISDKPLGENGFGWDNIFVPQKYHKTFAEMSSEEKDGISHRKIALGKLAAFLANKNNSP